MNGMVFGAIALVFVLLVVITRPIVARAGASYAFARPRHTFFIVIGLMVAGSVVVSAGIVGDSAGENVLDALLERTEYGDGLVASSNPRTFVTQTEAESVVDAPSLDGLVAHSSPGIRNELLLEKDDTGRARDDAVVWGVDPARHTPLKEGAVIAGDVPATNGEWNGDEVILTRRLAADLGADIGDAVTLYFPMEDDQPAPPVNSNSFSFGGHINLVTQNPLDDSYEHAPNDEYQVPFNLEPGTLQVLIDIELSAQTDSEYILHLLHEDTLHQEYPIDGDTGNITLVDVPLGEWTLEVHSPFAANVDFDGSITTRYRDPSYVPPSQDPVFVPLTVRALIGDDGSDLLTRSGVAFVPLSTLQEAFETDGVNALFVQATTGTDMDLFESRLEDAGQDTWSGGNPRVTVPMAGVEEFLEKIRSETQIFFFSSSMFTFLAGLLLIVVILALLVEERKTTIATMRAVGAHRSTITRMYIVEGALYAAGATLAAVVMAWLLLFSLRGPLGDMYSDIEGTFRLHLSPATILAAMGLAFALTVVTIALAAHRASRMDPVAAMRGDDESGKKTQSTGWFAAALVVAAGTLSTLYALLSDNALMLLLGPTILILGGALLARRWTRYRGVIPLASLAILGWAAWRLAEIDSNGGLSDFLVLPAGAILLGLSAAALFVHTQAIHDLVVRATAGLRGIGPVVDTALSHLRARPGRAFLTIGMLATVLLVITTMGTLVTTFSPSGFEETGGFEVLADTEHDLGDPQEYLLENPPRSGAEPFALMGTWMHTSWVDQANFNTKDEQDRYTRIHYEGLRDQSAAGITPEFIEMARFSSATTASEYDDLDHAMRAVASDPGLVIFTDQAYYRPFGSTEWDDRVPIDVGDRLTTARSGEAADGEVRVVAVIHDLDGVGSLAHPELIQTFAEQRGFAQPGTRIWANPANGVSDTELAQSLEAGFRVAGMQATRAADPYPEWVATDRAFALVFMVFLSLGLVIGIVALGLVTVRNTMVRRREIGVMRAVGGKPRQVLLVFAVEALYIVLVAIAIGLVGGLWTVYSMIRGNDFITLQDGVFLIADPLFLGTIYLVTLAAGIITAIASSWHAARVPPAEAVRYVE